MSHNEIEDINKRVFLIMRGPQEEMGNLLDVSQSTISLWKRCKSAPTRKTLQRISELFHVDIQWLTFGKTTDIGTLVNVYFPEDLKGVVDQDSYESVREFAGYATHCGEDELKHVTHSIAAYYEAATGVTALSPAIAHGIGEEPDYGEYIDAGARAPVEPETIEQIAAKIGSMRSQYKTSELGALLPSSEITSLGTGTPALMSAPMSLPMIGYAAADNAAASRAEIDAEAPGEEVQVIKEHYRLVKIIGNSMAPVLLDGQYAMIGRSIEAGEAIKAQGWIGIVQTKEETYCKRIYPVDGGLLLLVSINDTECQPITVARQQVINLWPVHGVFFMGHGVTPKE